MPVVNGEARHVAPAIPVLSSKGASGFLLKDAAADELLHAIRVIAAGEALLVPSIARRMIEDCARRPAPRYQPDALADLTARELEVMRLLARGMPNTDIARELATRLPPVGRNCGSRLVKNTAIFGLPRSLIRPRR
jgi:DNA-binding NarL/FixJ family response regulator